MLRMSDNLPRGARWACAKVPFKGANKLDNTEIPYSPILLTAEERNASYMAGIDRDLSSNIQYIHRDQWVSNCQPLSAKKHGRGLKTMRLSKKAHSANNLDISEEDEDIPPAKRRAHVVPERPHSVAFERATGSCTGVDEAKIEDVVSKKIEEAFARMFPRFVDAAVTEVIKRLDDYLIVRSTARPGSEDLETVKDDLGMDDLGKGEAWRQERDDSNKKSDFVVEPGDHGVSREDVEDVVDENEGIAKVGPSQAVATMNPKPTEGGGFTDGRKLRVKLKNSKFSSPFVDYREKKTEKQLKTKYENWKKKRSQMLDVGITPTWYQGPKYFKTIEDVRKMLSNEHIDPFLDVLSRRLYSGVKLKSGVSASRINIQDCALFRLLSNEWKVLHPDDPQCTQSYPNDANYERWDVPPVLVNYVRGTAIRWGSPWHTNPDHWVVCRVRLLDWEIELYDSFSHISSSKAGNDRELMLTPLRRLLPTLLHRSGYFGAMNLPPKLDALPIKRMSSEVQFVQEDIHNCGVFACMYVERMLGENIPRELDISLYRQKMALAIFAHDSCGLLDTLACSGYTLAIVVKGMCFSATRGKIPRVATLGILYAGGLCCSPRLAEKFRESRPWESCMPEGSVVHRDSRKIPASRDPGNPVCRRALLFTATRGKIPASRDPEILEDYWAQRTIRRIQLGSPKTGRGSVGFVVTAGWRSELGDCGSSSEVDARNRRWKVSHREKIGVKVRVKSEIDFALVALLKIDCRDSRL
ncbi:sentrin/SUMO-specific protease [Striga asiatica]|uniref:Sentrin/SUMO-specific protease n=1 Tax=Striga asiatica TaxID=4170 RepID=A0A5A7QRI4_STRAF|nr:sentrin/SUMO-specific protease [Striga asiatica]